MVLSKRSSEQAAEYLLLGVLSSLMRLRPIIPSQISLQPAYLANWGYANSKNNIIQKEQPIKAPLLPPPPTHSSEPPDSGLRTIFLALAKNGILLSSFFPLGVTIHPSSLTLGVCEISSACVVSSRTILRSTPNFPNCPSRSRSAPLVLSQPSNSHSEKYTFPTPRRTMSRVTVSD